jgi:hypothetical protein
MWIIGKYGFISIVQHDKDPSLMQVRSRVKMDILAYFPDARVVTMTRSDYMYRADIPRIEVARVLHDEVMDYDVTSHVKDVAIEYSYPNDERRAAYYDTWYALSRMQPQPPYSGFKRKTRKGKGKK